MPQVRVDLVDLPSMYFKDAWFEVREDGVLLVHPDNSREEVIGAFSATAWRAASCMDATIGSASAAPKR